MARSPDRGIVALDTNAVHDYFAAVEARGPKGPLIARAFEDEIVVLPPPVLSEALSDPNLLPEKAERIRELPVMELLDGFWVRAGLLRAGVLAQRYRAYLADCLIAQCCIDLDIPLITYDRDFTRFEGAGLKLI